MYTDWLGGVLVRDLKSLARQLESFTDERDIWKTMPGIANSAGTLTLHLAGNIQHFVGMQLGGSSYKRDRDAEFKRRDVPRAELLQQVQASIDAVQRVMPTLTDEALDQPYPQKIGDATVTTGDFLTHLAVHLTYHLGQIDYHRRMVTGAGSAPGMLSPGELSSATMSRVG